MKDAFTSMPVPGEVGEVPVVPNQCNATNRAGDRCNRSATFGMNVCHLHGGRAPQSLATQQRRFKEAAGDAMNNLVEMANGSTDESIKLRANIAILDRTGHGPSALLKLAQENSAPWTAWLTNEELEQVRAIRDAAIERMDAGETPFGEVREFDFPEPRQMVWLPKTEREQLPTGDEVIEAVFTRTEGQ
jgi:hypothetical protein